MNTVMLQDPRLVSGDTEGEMLYWDNTLNQYKPANNLTWDSTYNRLTIKGAPKQLRLSYDDSNYVDFEVSNEGNLSVLPTGSSGVLLSFKAADKSELSHQTILADDATDSFPIFSLIKSHGTTIDSVVETVDTELLGAFYFSGCDNTPSYNFGAKIYAYQSGSSGAYVPTQLYLMTYKTTGEATRLVLTETGRVGVQTSAPEATLDIYDGSGLPQLKLTDDATYNYEATFLVDGNGDLTITPSGSYLDLVSKFKIGSFGTPLDVTATREYGVELHFSGNDYNATAIRARAHAVTTDTTAQFQGGLFQAANNDGIDVGVLNGALIEAIGKSIATAATISTMRACIVNAEWSEYDTITDLRTLHVRTHTRNNATQGYFSNSGYGVYIENEAVGGNGQALDAGIYFKDTNISGGNSAFTYGIDFSGGTYATADILFSDGSSYIKAAGISLAGPANFTLAATDIYGLQIDGTTNPYVYSSGDETHNYVKRQINDSGSSGSAWPDEFIGSYFYTYWNYGFTGDGADLHNALVVSNYTHFYLSQPHGDGMKVTSWTGKPTEYTTDLVAGYSLFQSDNLYSLSVSGKTMIWNLIGGKYEFSGASLVYELDGNVQFNVIGGEFKSNLTCVVSGSPEINYYGGRFIADGSTIGDSTSYGGYFSGSGSDINYGIYVAAGSSVLLDTTIGDGGSTNYANFLSDGDLYWVGTGGLASGCMEGMDETVTCTNQNDWYQVTFDTEIFSNLTTINLTNEDMAVTYAGNYLIFVTACVHSAVAHDFEFRVYKNDGATALKPYLYQSTSVANQVENVSGSCIVDLDASDRLELWVRCTDAAGQDIIFDHVNLACFQIAGT